MELPARRAPGTRVLRVFFDFGHDWPLWESGTEKYAMEPSDYGFSKELTDLLRRWYLAWSATASFDLGQTSVAPSEEDHAELVSLRRQAIAVIHRETPPDVQVQVD